MCCTGAGCRTRSSGLEHQLRRLQEPGLRARVERRLALLRAERQEIERDMRAIVDGDPRKKALFACQNEAEIHQKAGEDFGFLLQALPAGSLKVT
jgi:hypothetical protein